jgi:rod shape-determining protein MreC
MFDRRRNRTALAVLVLVSLVLLTVDYRQGEQGSITSLQRGALTVLGPVQDGFAAAVRPIGNLVSSVRELGRLREHSAGLEAEVRQLREGRVTTADLVAEISELRALLQMRDRLGYTTTGAQVIALPPGAFEWTVLIDVGSQHGVEPGMAVINGDGLVGKLVEVSRRNARVQLLTSPSAGYAVRVAPDGHVGLLSGRGSRPFQLQILDPEARIAAGSEVVTRVFQGTSISDGIPVGVVEGRAPGGNPRFLAVRPYVDFSKLNFVQVVLDAPVQPMALPDDELVDPPDRPRPQLPPATEPEDSDAGDADDEEAPA